MSEPGNTDEAAAELAAIIAKRLVRYWSAGAADTEAREIASLILASPVVASIRVAAKVEALNDAADELVTWGSRTSVKDWLRARALAVEVATPTEQEDQKMSEHAPGSKSDKANWLERVGQVQAAVDRGSACPHVESWSVWVSGHQRTRCAVCHRILARRFAQGWVLVAATPTEQEGQ